jgi:ABC-type glycerol-3-phosphate transport system substrate-binding protein
MTPLLLRLAVAADGPDLDQIIRAFEARNPGTCVVRITGDVPGYLQAGAADVVATKNLDVKQAVANRQLLPLDSLLEADHLDLAALGALSSDVRQNGHTYELPITASPYVILYNQEHFDRAGLAVPAPWWTWDDFRTTVTALAARTPAGSWAFSDDGVPPSAMAVAFAEDRTEGQPINPEAAAAALDFWSGLFTAAHGVAPSSFKNVDRWAEFRQGLGAMLLTPLNGERVSELNAAGFQWGVLALPEAKGGPGAVKVGRPETYAIAAGAKHVDLAWKFLAFASGPVAAGIWANGGAFPVRRTDDSRQAWRERLPASMGREWLLEREWALMFTRNRGDLAEKARGALSDAVAAVPRDKPLAGAALDFQAQYLQWTAVTP